MIGKKNQAVPEDNTGITPVAPDEAQPQEPLFEPDDPVSLLTGDANPQPQIQPTEEMAMLGLGRLGRALTGQVRPPSVTGGAARATEQEAESVLEQYSIGKVVDPARTPNRNFSLNYIGSADDFDEEVTRMMDIVAEEREFGTAEGMGPRAHATTIRAAREERINIEEFLGRKLRGGPKNADELTAMRMMLTEAAYELKEKAGTIVNENGQRLPTVTDEDMYDFRQMLNTYAAMQYKFQGAVKEVGRMLNAMQIPVGTDPLGGTNMSELLMRQGGGARGTTKAAAAIFQAKTPEEIAHLARGSWLQRAGRGLYEVWINGLLSGGATHVKNISGNFVTSVLTIPEHYLAAGIGKVRGGADRITIGETNARMYGMAQGYNEGIRLAFRNFWNNDGTEAAIEGVNAGKMDFYRKPEFSAENFGVNENHWFGKGIDMLGHWYVRLPGRVLQAEDDLFQAVGYRMELNAQAYSRTLSEGFEEGSDEFYNRLNEIVLDPDFQLHEQAREFAKYQTFTNELEGPWSNAVQLVQSTPVGKMFLPFVRTPINILKYATARTPFAALLPSWRADIAAGGAKRDLAMARVGLGTMMAVTLTSAVNHYGEDGSYRPRITGAPPRNPKMAELWREYGITPYSIYMDGEYVPYNWAEPFGMQLSMIADFNHMLHHVQDPQMKQDMMVAYVSALATYTTDKSYVQGFKQLMDLVNQGPTSGALRMPSSFVPTWLANVRKDVDPVTRETRFATPAWDVSEADDTERALAGGVGRMLAYFKNRIPGWSDELAPRTDVWGEVLYLGEPIWQWHSISPAVGHGIHYEPATVELIQNGVSGREPTPVVTVETMQGKIKVDLMQHEKGQDLFFDLRQKIGRARRAQVTEAIQSQYYIDAGVAGEERAEALDMAMGAGRTQGINEFKMEYNDQLQELALAEFARREATVPSQLPGLMP